MAKAIYPGSFDPFTNGHLDIVRRAAKLFDRLAVAVGDNPTKKPLFSRAERVEMIREVVGSIRNVEVLEFDGLLVDFAKKKGYPVVLRGVRTVSDFDYEFQMALTNRALAPAVETVFLITAKEYAFVSSKLIKEAASLGGDVEGFLPPPIAARLKARFPA